MIIAPPDSLNELRGFVRITSNQYFPAAGSFEAITVPLMPSAESVSGISTHCILALSTSILRVAEVTGPGWHFQEKV